MPVLIEAKATAATAVEERVDRGTTSWVEFEESY